MANEELELLKERADLMGIKYAKNIGLEALKTKIAAAQIGEEAEEEAAPAKSKKKAKIKTDKKEQSALKRIILSNNDPQYKGRQGLLVSVGNEHFNFSKFIKFDTEYHVPQMVYNHIKNERFYQDFIEKKNPDTGRKYKVSVTKKACVVEDLPPLTQEELEELRTQQAVNRSID